jgi:alkanesulfonate monooxygenase SsuD/methylene tetrahydromethanopterin reductase-like flavin-dependent oxidoreductase (luciferase family)
MRFGLSFLPDADPRSKPATTYYEDALALAQFADWQGLHSIKMTEHYLHSYGGYCPSPLSFLSAVASCKRSIRLVTGAILPSFHHPIAIASETSMVDALSGGRLDVGFGRAYLPYDSMPSAWISTTAVRDSQPRSSA